MILAEILSLNWKKKIKICTNLPFQLSQDFLIYLPSWRSYAFKPEKPLIAVNCS